MELGVSMYAPGYHAGGTAVVFIGRSWRLLEETSVTLSGKQCRCGPYSEAPKTHK